jgi:hypothetical protein
VICFKAKREDGVKSDGAARAGRGQSVLVVVDAVAAYLSGSRLQLLQLLLLLLQDMQLLLLLLELGGDLVGVLEQLWVDWERGMWVIWEVWVEDDKAGDKSKNIISK